MARAVEHRLVVQDAHRPPEHALRVGVLVLGRDRGDQVVEVSASGGVVRATRRPGQRSGAPGCATRRPERYSKRKTLNWWPLMLLRALSSGRAVMVALVGPVTASTTGPNTLTSVCVTAAMARSLLTERPSRAASTYSSSGVSRVGGAVGSPRPDVGGDRHVGPDLDPSDRDRDDWFGGRALGVARPGGSRHARSEPRPARARPGAPASRRHADVAGRRSVPARPRRSARRGRDRTTISGRGAAARLRRLRRTGVGAGAEPASRSRDAAARPGASRRAAVAAARSTRGTTVGTFGLRRPRRGARGGSAVTRARGVATARRRRDRRSSRGSARRGAGSDAASYGLLERGRLEARLRRAGAARPNRPVGACREAPEEPAHVSTSST